MKKSQLILLLLSSICLTLCAEEKKPMRPTQMESFGKINTSDKILVSVLHTGEELELSDKARKCVIAILRASTAFKKLELEAKPCVYFNFKNEHLAVSIDLVWCEKRDEWYCVKFPKDFIKTITNDDLSTKEKAQKINAMLEAKLDEKESEDAKTEVEKTEKSSVEKEK